MPRVNNPASGTSFSLAYGESLELVFELENNNDNLTTFAAQISGIDRSWTPIDKGTGTAGAYGAAQVVVHLQAPVDATAGEYGFRVNFFERDEPHLSEASRSYSVSYAGAPVVIAPPEPKPEPRPEPKPEPAQEPEPAPAPTPEPEPVAPMAPPVAAAPPVSKAPPAPRKATPKPPAPDPEPVTMAPASASASAPPAPELTVAAPVEGATATVQAPESPAPEPEPVPAYEPEPIPEPVPEQEPMREPERPAYVAPSYSPVAPLRPEVSAPVAAAPISPEPTATPPTPVAPTYTPSYTPPPPKVEAALPPPMAPPEPKLVDLAPQPPSGSTIGFATKQAKTESAVDREIQGPANGTTISAKPGERIRLKFSVKNDSASVANYEISYDWTHPERWINLEQQIVSIDPDANGYVSCLLEPPHNARAGSYRFQVRYGVLGEPPTQVSLTLSVGAVPSVGIAVKQAKVSVGPFGRNVDFDVKVQNPSNADTAYRLAIKDPEAQYDRDGEPVGNDNLYETPKWRFLVDRELDTVESPRPDRPSQPVDHRVRAYRRGVWWFGWVESIKATLAAVPVTDAKNASVPGNASEIVAKRWRLFPLPWFLMVPLAIVLFILVGSAPSKLRVTNALVGDDNVAYILGDAHSDVAFDVPMKVQIEYDAPGYAMVGASKVQRDVTSPVGGTGHNTVTDNAVVPKNSYGSEQTTTYFVRSKFFGGGESVTVRFVPLRTENILAVADSTGRPLPFTTEDYAFGGRTVKSRVYNVVVPAGGLKALQLRNTTPTTNTSSLEVYSVLMPSGFEVGNIRSREFALNNGGTEYPKIKVSGDATEGTWVLATTDASCPVVQIKLRNSGAPATNTDGGPSPSPTPTTAPTPTTQPTPSPTPTQKPAVSVNDVTDKAARKSVFDGVRGAIKQKRSASGDVVFATTTHIYTGGGYAVVTGQPLDKASTQPLGGPIVAVLKKSGGGWSLIELADGADLAGLVHKHPEIPQELAR